jgi:hypothetical protein
MTFRVFFDVAPCFGRLFLKRVSLVLGEQKKVGGCWAQQNPTTRQKNFPATPRRYIPEDSKLKEI